MINRIRLMNDFGPFLLVHVNVFERDESNLLEHEIGTFSTS